MLPKFSISPKTKSFRTFEPSVVVFREMWGVGKCSEVVAASSLNLHIEAETAKLSWRINTVFFVLPVNQSTKSVSWSFRPFWTSRPLSNINYNHIVSFITPGTMSIRPTLCSVGMVAWIIRSAFQLVTTIRRRCESWYCACGCLLVLVLIFQVKRCTNRFDRDLSTKIVVCAWLPLTELTCQLFAIVCLLWG